MSFPGVFYQFGVVTDDLERAIAQYSALGAAGWKRMDTRYRARYRDWTGEVANRNAFALWQGHCLELIQPGAGRTNAMEWLEERGPGLFHLGFRVDDPACLKRADICFETLDTRTAEGLPAVIHLDTVATLGYFIELSDGRLVDRLNAWIADQSDAALGA